MFHVKHPLQFSCSIFSTVLIVLGNNFTQAVRFGFAWPMNRATFWQCP
jgi:hypothetical protein